MTLIKNFVDFVTGVAFFDRMMEFKFVTDIVTAVLGAIKNW